MLRKIRVYFVSLHVDFFLPFRFRLFTEVSGCLGEGFFWRFCTAQTTQFKTSSNFTPTNLTGIHNLQIVPISFSFFNAKEAAREDESLRDFGESHLSNVACFYLDASSSPFRGSSLERKIFTSRDESNGYFNNKVSCLYTNCFCNLKDLRYER